MSICTPRVNDSVECAAEGRARGGWLGARCRGGRVLLRGRLLVLLLVVGLRMRRRDGGMGASL